MKKLNHFTKRLLNYPWQRARRSLLAMGLFVVLGAPGWSALYQADKTLSVFLTRAREEDGAAGFFHKILREREDWKELYGLKETGEVALDAPLRELNILAKEEGIRLDSLKPAVQKEKKDREGIRRRPIELAFRSPEDGIYRFLAGLADLSFFSSPATLAVSASAQDPSLVDVRLTLDVFDGLRLSRSGAREYLKKMVSFGRVSFGILPYVAASEKKIFGSMVPKPRNVILTQEKKEDILKHLTLVGIIEDGPIRAALEDKRTSKTFTVSVDDALGDLMVLEIGDQKIVFSAGGQCYTLTL